VLTMKCILVDMEIILMKSTCVWKENEQLWFLKINAYKLHQKCQDVFNGCVHFISTMICFAYDGKNDRWWMVLNVLRHFQHRDIVR
jgi:hypothetical protein